MERETKENKNESKRSTCTRGVMQNNFHCVESTKVQTNPFRGNLPRLPSIPVFGFGVPFSLFVLSRLGQSSRRLSCCTACCAVTAFKVGRDGVAGQSSCARFIITTIKSETFFHLEGRRKVTRCAPIRKHIRSLHALPCRTGQNPRNPGPQFLQGWLLHKEGSWREA